MRKKSFTYGVIAAVSAVAFASLAPLSAQAATTTMTVTAGPINKGHIAIDSISCVRTDEAGDWGTFTLSGSFLQPPVGDDYQLSLQDKVSGVLLEVQDVAAGATSFSYTQKLDGTNQVLPAAIYLSKPNARGAMATIDRLVTMGKCGWLNLAAIQVPRVFHVRVAGDTHQAHLTNFTNVPLVTDVSFTKITKVNGVTRHQRNWQRVTLPPSGYIGWGAVVANVPLTCDEDYLIETALGNAEFGARAFTDSYFVDEDQDQVQGCE